MAYLDIQNLSVTYCQGGIHAVRDCNLQLNRGETLGIPEFAMLANEIARRKRHD